MKKLLWLLSFLIVTACASREATLICNPGDPGCTEPPPPPPPVTLEELIVKVRASLQFKQLVMGNTNQPNRPKTVEEGVNFFKGIDKLIALRYYYLTDGTTSAFQNNKIGLIGDGIRGSFAPNVSTFNCTGSTCTAGASATQFYYSNSALQALAGGYDINLTSGVSQNAVSPMGLAFGSSVSFYQVTSASALNTITPNGTNIKNAIQKAQTDGVKILIAGYGDRGRFSNTYLKTATDTHSQSLGKPGAPSCYSPTANCYVSGLDNSTAYRPPQVANNVVPTLEQQQENIAQIGSAYNAYLKADKQNTLVLTTGTNSKRESGVVTDLLNNTLISNEYYSLNDTDFGIYSGSFVTGDIIRYLEGKNDGAKLTNQIVIANPVGFGGFNAKGDAIYKPYNFVVLPGSLKEYTFSVPVLSNSVILGFDGNQNECLLGSNAGGCGTVTNTESQVTQFAASRLGGILHTVSLIVGSNDEAIEQTKNFYTKKEYAESWGTYAGTGTVPNGMLVTMSTSFVRSFAGAHYKSSMINYYSNYCNGVTCTISHTVNGTTYSQSYNPNAGEEVKWNAILFIWSQDPAGMSQFFTAHDVVIKNGSNIVAVNGVVSNNIKEHFLPYNYIDKDGNPQSSTVIAYSADDGQTFIPSNIFGNGVVDFETIDKTFTVAGQNVLNARGRTSSVLGQAFKKGALAEFLGSTQLDVVGVHENTDVITVDLAANINGASSRRSSALQALVTPSSEFGMASITQNLAVLGGNLNFSLTGADNGFSGSSHAAKQFSYRNGFVGGASRFERELSMEYNINSSYSSSLALSASPVYINAVGFGWNVAESTTIFVGSAVNGSYLGLGTSELGFSIREREIGLTDGYKNYSEFLNNGGQQIKSTALSHEITKGLKSNLVAAVGEQASLGALELKADVRDSGYSVTTGVLLESNGFLGSKFEGGAYDVAGARTAFISIEAKQHLAGSYFAKGYFTAGQTNVENKNGAFFSYSGIKSQGFGFGLYDTDFFGGTFGLAYFEPIRLTGGRITAFNGNTTGMFSLSSGGRERAFEASYALSAAGLELQTSLLHQIDAGNIKGEQSSTILLKASKHF